MNNTIIITIEELMNKKADALKALAIQLKKEITDTTTPISSLTTKKKLADYIIANAPSDKYWFLHENQEILDTDNRVATTGTSIPKERVEASYKEKCSNLSDFEVMRAKNEIVKCCELNETIPELSWENIYFMHKELQHTVQHQKREITKQIKVLGCNVAADYDTGYFTIDLSKTLDVADITGDTNVNEFLFEVAVPYADLMETCERLNVNLITFDPEGLEIPEGLGLKEALTRTYKYGLVDVSTNDKYFPIGLSASKARSGGVIWLARVANWNAMELLRAEVLHLTTEEYENMKKDDCVIAKFETGTIGMRTSSVINVSKAGKKLRGESSILNNIKCKVVDDIVGMRNLTTLEPDKEAEGNMKPFKFSLTEREYEVNYSDGSSIIKIQPYMDILHQAGEITDNQYTMFTTKWLASGYDVKVLKEDKELHRFLTSKDFKSVMQVRFFGGVKGMVIPVAQMDADVRLADVDMLVFKKSAKYISQDAPFEIINFGKFKSTIVKDENDNVTNVLESAKLNYQFVQSSGANGATLIKGVLKPFADVKDALISAPNALKAIAGMRGLDDEGDDLLTVLARDLEVEPRLLTEHYHQNKLMDKLEKFVKEIGYGRIPVKGGFRFIISDPVWLYHMAMGDAFESQLEATQVYYNGVSGRKAGMFRSPMIHYSEPQEVECADVDYLWMYQGIIVINVKDAIAAALGGAKL